MLKSQIMNKNGLYILHLLTILTESYNSLRILSFLNKTKIKKVYISKIEFHFLAILITLKITLKIKFLYGKVKIYDLINTEIK